MVKAEDGVVEMATRDSGRGAGRRASGAVGREAGATAGSVTVDTGRSSVLAVYSGRAGDATGGGRAGSSK